MNIELERKWCARTLGKDLRRLDQYDHWLDYDFADGVVTREEYDIGKGWIHAEMAQRVESLRRLDAAKEV